MINQSSVFAYLDNYGALLKLLSIDKYSISQLSLVIDYHLIFHNPINKSGKIRELRIQHTVFNLYACVITKRQYQNQSKLKNCKCTL